MGMWRMWCEVLLGNTFFLHHNAVQSYKKKGSSWTGLSSYCGFVHHFFADPYMRAVGVMFYKDNLHGDMVTVKMAGCVWEERHYPPVESVSILLLNSCSSSTIGSLQYADIPLPPCTRIAHPRQQKCWKNIHGLNNKMAPAALPTRGAQEHHPLLFLKLDQHQNDQVSLPWSKLMHNSCKP